MPRSLLPVWLAFEAARAVSSFLKYQYRPIDRNLVCSALQHIEVVDKWQADTLNTTCEVATCNLWHCNVYRFCPACKCFSLTLRWRRIEQLPVPLESTLGLRRWKTKLVGSSVGYPNESPKWTARWTIWRTANKNIDKTLNYMALYASGRASLK